MFISDKEKMKDFLKLSKEEFLKLYPNITKKEYTITQREYYIRGMVEAMANWSKRIVL